MRYYKRGIFQKHHKIVEYDRTTKKRFVINVWLTANEALTAAAILNSEVSKGN